MKQTEFQKKVNRDIGEQLRNTRRKLKLTLAEAAQRTNGTFSASILGAYERSDRQITAARYLELIAIYEQLRKEREN